MKKQNKTKNRQAPRNGISMIGTAFLVQYSIHWPAAKFAIKGEQIFKIIWNKCIYSKEQKLKYSVENWVLKTFVKIFFMWTNN